VSYLAGSEGNRKKLSSGFARLFFEQFTAEHHIFGPVLALTNKCSDCVPDIYFPKSQEASIIT